MTFRTADSLPKVVLERLEKERRLLPSALFLRRLDDALDAGHGTAPMRTPAVADVVASAFRHFDGVRYELLAWCVMPNHVHVLFRELANEDLGKVIHSWKSFTSNCANVILGRTGRFWSRDYFDRVIRNDEDLRNVNRYILMNPEKAGLIEWAWMGSVL